MLDRDQVRKVANLARLELTPAEEERFTTQLSGILDYFEQLNQLDTEKVKPTTRAIDMSNVTRADDLKPCDDLDSIWAVAPDREDDFFKVPQILGGGE